MTTAANIDARSVSDTYEEGLRYFMGSGSVNETLKRLASDLKSHNIDYVVIGAVALLAHGYPRFTEDIDLVMTRDGLEKFHRELVGLGYVPAFPQAKKRLRATAEGVSIDVMLAGEYPGDGKPKPVSVPDPAAAAIDINGIKFVTLEKLVELKLASGMTAPDRLKDLADVQELIKVRALPAEFAEQLDPYVRAKFLELYDTVKQSPKD
ncbi:MAG: hypothetical protein QOF62_1633 [Pyrinomonadaceae bacterium]|jgi:hypothetical protein|nr:hypothetical protein [Pyrinomonadaceae bacterium]